jgi:CDP-paratose 2-epimerase
VSVGSVLITGGAGFVGASLAASYREAHPGSRVVALDNLRRRGSELNLPRLRRLGIEFVHGDVRCARDLEAVEGSFDLVVDASAEPSVLAGLDGSPHYVLETNLGGTLSCLELARRRAGALVFLSTSRVYSIAPLRQLRLREEPSRFEMEDDQPWPGAGARGIAEEFPTHLPRSLYGASKLASEMIVQEYADTYGLRAVIDRCGVIAGPGQFGKVEQGVFTLWVAAHVFGRPLEYRGFGGAGKQVRDLLHPRDLFALLERQVPRLEPGNAEVFNVGGGREVSTSLRELTDLCREVTGREVPVAGRPDTTPVDVPLFLTDAGRARERFGWAPQVGLRALVEEVHAWLRQGEVELAPLFA